MVETHGMLALSFGRELCHLPPSWRALLMPLYVIYRRPQRCDSSGHCPNRGASRYLLRREEVVPHYRTRCAITRCREIMTPQLSIVKTRFAKASLRPRCARHRSWGATCLFPNACVGHSASQLMRWTLSFPIDALDTQLPSSRDGSSSKITERAEHPSTSGPLLSVPTIELLHSITLSITGITRG